MKLDVMLRTTDPWEVPEYARAAEALGIDGLACPEATFDPYVRLGLAAANTSRIGLTTAIALAFPRSPMITAYAAWDLHRLSRGRFILGLGSQVRAHMLRRFSTPWDSPVVRMREYVESLKHIWRNWHEGVPLNYQGKFYQFSLMSPQWTPPPSPHGPPPVYLAAVGPQMLRAAGTVADGVQIHPINTRRYIEDGVIATVAGAVKNAGRDPSHVRFVTSAFVITGRNGQEVQEARKVVRQRIAFYASTPQYRDSLLQFHGWGEVGDRLTRMAREQQWNAMGDFIPDEMEREVAVSGVWDELGPALAAKYSGLVDRVILYQDFRPGVQDEFWRAMVAGLRDTRA